MAQGGLRRYRSDPASDNERGSRTRIGFKEWNDLVRARDQAYAQKRRGWLLRHCLEYVADELYQGAIFGVPLTAAQRDIARTGFCLMGEVDDRGSFKRNWTTREKIARVAGLPAPRPDVDAFIRRFTEDHRLLWVRGNGDIDVSHESLMRNWSQLARWLTENKEAGDAYRHLAERYIKWKRASRDRFPWLSWFRRRNGYLGDDDLERIEPLLTRRPALHRHIEPRYNDFWAQRFVPADGRATTESAADQTEGRNISLGDVDFEGCFDYLRKSLRRNMIHRHLGSILVVSMFAVIAVSASWIAFDQKQFASQQTEFASQKAKLVEFLNSYNASSLWSGLGGWEPVPSSVYVANLWQLALSPDDVRVDFVKQIPAGNIVRQMGFRPQPIIRAIGLRWPEEVRKIISDGSRAK